MKSQFEKVTEALMNGEEGYTITNEDTGWSVEVTNMAGGRYLVYDEKGLPSRQTDDPAIAYKHLMETEVDRQVRTVVNTYHRVLNAHLYEGYEYRTLKAALEFLLEEVNKL